jgi:hypothetical protein
VARFVFVISPKRPDLYQNLAREFADETAVLVVVDRRVTERRHSGASPPADADDRRKGERRTHHPARRDIALLGYTFVRVADQDDQ